MGAKSQASYLLIIELELKYSYLPKATGGGHTGLPPVLLCEKMCYWLSISTTPSPFADRDPA
jgi:hypothetical protein